MKPTKKCPQASGRFAYAIPAELRREVAPRIVVLRETHETPEFVERRLTLAGGRNRFGEPMYRAVWGANRLTLIGGRWEVASDDGAPEEWAYRWVPKYAVNRWHIEKWLAPETYGSPRTWWGTTKERELGPYPVRGDYEHVFTVETATGGFLQLTTTIAEEFARALEYSRKFSSGQRWASIKDREAKAEREYDAYADMVLNDGPAFGKQPFVTVA